MAHYCAALEYFVTQSLGLQGNISSVGFLKHLLEDETCFPISLLITCQCPSVLSESLKI